MILEKITLLSFYFWSWINTTLKKILKNEKINVDNLVRICGVWGCNFGEITEYVPDEKAIIKFEPGNWQLPDLQEGEHARVLEEG